MFEEEGWVDSPFLGKLSASEFFAKLGKASSRNILTVHDILFGEHGDSVAAQFEYDWTLKVVTKLYSRGLTILSLVFRTVLLLCLFFTILTQLERALVISTSKFNFNKGNVL